MNGHSHDVPCTWWLSWLAAAYRKVLVGTGWAIIAQTDVETTPVGVLFLALCRQFQSGGAFTGQRALNMKS